MFFFLQNSTFQRACRWLGWGGIKETFLSLSPSGQTSLSSLRPFRCAKIQNLRLQFEFESPRRNVPFLVWARHQNQMGLHVGGAWGEWTCGAMCHGTATYICRIWFSVLKSANNRSIWHQLLTEQDWFFFVCLSLLLIVIRFSVSKSAISRSISPCSQRNCFCSKAILLG